MNCEMAADSLPINRPKAPVWKVAVVGFSFMAMGFGTGLGPAFATRAAGYAAATAQLLNLLAALAIACAVSAFARRHVVTGSMMSYVFFVFGNWGRAVVGSCLFLGYLISVAAVASSTQVFVLGLARDLGFDTSAALLECAPVIVIIGSSIYFVCQGLEASVRLSLVLSFACLPPLFTIIVAAAWHNGLAIEQQTDLTISSIPHIVEGAGATWAFLLGFEGLTTLAKETEDPKRNVPRILYALVLVTGLLACVATFLDTPVLVSMKAALAAGDSPVGVLADAGRLHWLRLPTNLLLAISGIAMETAMCAFAARVIATAALDGLLPSWFGHIDPATQSPNRAAKAIGVIGALGLIVPLLVTHISPVELSSYYASTGVMYWLLPYLMICVGAIIQEVKHDDCSKIVVLASGFGAVAMAFMIIQTAVSNEPGLASWLPYIVLFTAGPLAIVFALRSRNRKVTDF